MGEVQRRYAPRMALCLIIGALVLQQQLDFAVVTVVRLFQAFFLQHSVRFCGGSSLHAMLSNPSAS
jgi:hypothetical protein